MNILENKISIHNYILVVRMKARRWSLAHAHNIKLLLLLTPLADDANIFSFPFDLSHFGESIDATEASEKFHGV